MMIVAGVAAVTLALPGGSWGIHRAQQVASVVSHQPCAGRVVVAVELLPHGTAGYADQAMCRVTLDPMSGAFPTQAAVCHVMIHEYLHLAGYRDPVTGDVHSSNRRSVMWPTFNPARPDGRCRGHGVPYLRSRGYWLPRN